jgi:hypothetical protein
MHPADRNKRHFFAKAKKSPLITSADAGVMFLSWQILILDDQQME